MTGKEAIEIVDSAIRAEIKASRVGYELAKAWGIVVNLAEGKAKEASLICPLLSDDEVKQPCIEGPCISEDAVRAYQMGHHIGYIHGQAEAENKQASWVLRGGELVCEKCGGICRDRRVKHMQFCNVCGAKMRTTEEGGGA